jgi:hypothetical protein
VARRRQEDGRNWVDLRAEHRAALSDKLRRSATEEAVAIQADQMRKLSELIDASMAVALAALANGEVNGAEAGKLALAALRAQIYALGLDRSSQVEQPRHNAPRHASGQIRALSAVLVSPVSDSKRLTNLVNWTFCGSESFGLLGRPRLDCSGRVDALTNLIGIFDAIPP